MRAVHIGIGHDDDLVVAELVHIEIVTDARAEGHDHRADGLAGEDAVDAGLLHIEDLAAEREDRLVPAVAAGFRAAPCGVPFDDVDLGELRVALGAVRELARQAGDLEGVLAAGEGLRLLRRFPRAPREEALLDDGFRVHRVLREEFLQAFAHDAVHDALHFGVAQLCLRLPFELRIRHLHADNACEAFPHVVAGEILLARLEEIVRPGVVVDDAGERRAEARQMHAAFHRVDVVHEGVHVLAVAVLVLHGDVHDDPVLLPFEGDDLLIDQVLALVQVLHVLRDAAGVAELHFLLAAGAFVREGDGEAFIEKRQLAHALFQHVVVEIGAFLEDLRVGQEGDGRAGVLRLAHDLHVFGLLAAGEGHLVDVAVPLDLHAGPHGEGVHHGDAHAVEAAGDGVAVAAELAARVEHGEHHFHGGLARLVHVRGDAAAVVVHGAAPVLIDGHLDVGAVAGERLVDAVVHHFVHQMMEAAARRGADVHPRAETHRLEAFQHADILRAVILRAPFLLLMRLDFMDLFAHIVLP